MKIRAGFVSNSSSSSFIIIKSYFSAEQFLTLLIDLDRKFENECDFEIEIKENYVQYTVDEDCREDFYIFMKELQVPKQAYYEDR